MNQQRTNAVMAPCPEWREKLAAVHTDDLSLSERTALNTHVATCSACAAVRAQYQEMDQLIKQLPPITSLAELPSQIQTMIADHNDEAMLLSKSQPRLHEIEQQYTHAPTRNTKGAKQGRLVRLVSSLAAVLIVALIASSAFALFTHHHAPSTNVGSSTQSLLYSYGVSNPAPSSAALNAQLVALKAQPVAPKIKTKVLPSILKTVPKATVISLKAGNVTLTPSIAPKAQSGTTIYARHPENGALAWHTTLAIGAWDPLDLTPHNGVLFVPGLLGTEGQDTVLYALNANTGSVLWKHNFSRSARFINGPVVDGDVLYVGTYDGVYALRLDDGSQIWHVKVPSASSSMGQFGTPVDAVARGIVYVNCNGGLCALRGSDGHMLWQNHQISYFWAKENTDEGRLTVSGNNIYVLSDQGNQLYTLQADNGKILHTFSNASSVTAINGGVLYSSVNPDKSTTLTALRSSDDHTLWQKKFNDDRFNISVAAVDESTVYIDEMGKSIADGGKYIALDTNTGVVKWQWQDPDGSFNSGVVRSFIFSADGEMIFGQVTAMHGKLYLDGSHHLGHHGLWVVANGNGTFYPYKDK